MSRRNSYWPRKSRKPISLEAARLVASRSIQYAEAGLIKAGKADDSEDVRRWVHCITQSVGAYGNLCETVDLAAEIEEIKRQLPMRRVA